MIHSEHTAPPALGDLLRSQGVAFDGFEPMPTTGVSHDHFRILGSPWIARVPRLSQLDLDAETQLAIQEAAFERAQPTGAAPRLLTVGPVSVDLPRGALIVEAIDGRPPSDAGDLPAIGRCLAAIHGLAMPPPVERAPIATPSNPLHELAARTTAAMRAYLPRAPLGERGRAVVKERLAWLQAMARDRTVGLPRALCVTDAHPGNFVIRPGGDAAFVDLEKPVYGCPAVDLAHAVIDIAAGWDPAAGMRPTAADRAAFIEAWLAAVPPALAEATEPLILPFRQAVWLRTFSFFLRWRAESALQGPWSASRLGPEAAAHFRAHIDHALTDDAILEAAEAWA